MNNPNTITVDLPPRLLDMLEVYVRAHTAAVTMPNGIEGRLALRAAEHKEQLAAERVLFNLMVEMRELGIGTLGEALNEHWLKQQAPASDCSPGSRQVDKG